MKHAALLLLRITHAYHGDGRSADLDIEPTAETEELLRDHRCKLVPDPSGLRVVTGLDDLTGQPFLPLPAGAALRFNLRLRNTDFPLFTDLTALQAQPAPLFTSSGAPPGTAGDLTLTSGPPLPRGVLAGVEIFPAGQGTGAQPPVYNVAFSARQLRWAYYCVTDLPANGDPISIVDASPPGTPDVLLFGESNRTELTDDPDPSDPIATQITARYQGARCVRLLSDQPVSCSERPRRYLELRHGTDRLSGPLPNPSVRSVSRSSSPQQPFEFLFQIVKYLTSSPV